MVKLWILVCGVSVPNHHDKVYVLKSLLPLVDIITLAISKRYKIGM